MASEQPACKLCGQRSVSVRYRGPIRAGSFGRTTDQDFSVLQCSHCEVAYLDPFPLVDYELGSYRQAYNDSELIESYFSLHDSNQIAYLSMMKGTSFRGKVVGDFGCGGGSFLDHVRGLAKETIAIEPFKGYHQSLRQRGHRVYGYGKELLLDPNRPELDIAVSLAVVEHVSDPISYLAEIRESLGQGGILFLYTNNLNDILMHIGPDAYKCFNFRTAHLWYFNANSLLGATKTAGFSDSQVMFQHHYDLSNALYWLLEQRPTGLGKTPYLDERINAVWKTFLEEKGISDYVWVKCRR